MMFTNLKDEHLAARCAAGLFEIFGQFLDESLAGDFLKRADGKAIYCAMLHDDGSAIDDLVCIREAAGTDLGHSRPETMRRGGRAVSDQGDGVMVEVLVGEDEVTAVSQDVCIVESA